MNNRINELVRAGKFAIVGVANTLIDMGIFALLTQLAGLDIYLSQVVSFACGLSNSYIWNRSWTFASKERFWSPTLVRFVVCNLVSLTLSTAALWLLHDQLGLATMVAKLGSVAVSMVINFIISRLWVFSS